MRYRHPSTLGVISILYGNGLISFDVIAGICAFSLLTILMMFIIDFCNEDPAALKNLLRSYV